MSFIVQTSFGFSPETFFTHVSDSWWLRKRKRKSLFRVLLFSGKPRAACVRSKRKSSADVTSSGPSQMQPRLDLLRVIAKSTKVTKALAVYIKPTYYCTLQKSNTSFLALVLLVFRENLVVKLSLLAGAVLLLYFSCTCF